VSYYFIEMGQGIVSGPDLRVRSSTLYNCTMIAGFNSVTRRAGAYHFPSERLGNRDVMRDMKFWADLLLPTQIFLIHADPNGVELGIGGATGSSMKDKIGLSLWARARVSENSRAFRIAGQTRTLVASSPGMYCVGQPATFRAGDRRDLGADGWGPRIDLSAVEEGRYMDRAPPIMLVGRNRAADDVPIAAAPVLPRLSLSNSSSGSLDAALDQALPD